MIAVAIVCAAAFVNAATVGWSFGLINGYGTDGSGWSDSGLTGDVTVQLIIGTTLTGGVIGDTIYDAESTVAFDGGYAYPDALEISGMANDTPYYSKLIITSGDSTLESGVFQLAAAAMEGGVVYPGYGMGADSYGIGWTQYIQFSWRCLCRRWLGRKCSCSGAYEWASYAPWHGRPRSPPSSCLISCTKPVRAIDESVK